ncbi:ABC transporter ATP-binding protein [Ruania alkalisoli]|uniref:ABC transporter ATP-binding protein n=1 Tax=Ruania alkalisoli TaxID=2779775 RepID=A0A7M1ST82_9MICO|nr:ATP-binding cassette domain-containing protein [Ruania alkalisoli]QOR70337.1 ABC transporter ATP-binding protein [Ruania alkalisoli]
MSDPLVRLNGVSKVFRGRGGAVTAVDDVDLEVRRGETVGLVGESGSGKSTVARLVMGLQPVSAGTVEFDGRPMTSIKGRQAASFRRRAQMIFQNPFGSLLPHFTAAANVAEPLRLHRVAHAAAGQARARELLELVGLPPRSAELYPHQFSGGQQQRIAIARALALEPELLVCDEPTSALDVSVQAQILSLLERLKDELGLTMLFISHHLGVVEKLADTVAVMSRGRLVEQGPAEALFEQPRHPYTRQLLAAVLPVRGEPVPLPEDPWRPEDDDSVRMTEVGPGHRARIGAAEHPQAVR